MNARNSMRAVAAILLMANTAIRCFPQEPAATPNVIEQAMVKAGEGKLLAAMALLEVPKVDDQGILSALRSFAGDWQGAHEAANSYYPKPPKDAVAFSQPVTPLSALDEIAKLAMDQRVVIVNEAHHVPQHRAFILQLLRKLRSQGFKYYAAETLGENVQETHKRGYPVRSTGFYSVDPVFGDLIREALAMGFQLVAYEATFDASTDSDAARDPLSSISARETAQCQNLIDRLFTGDPEAKVVIHVGFDHVLERPRKLKDGKEISWMATRLARKLDKDLLTIDQTLHTERGTTALATPQWRQANENGWLDQPIVVRNSDGSFVVTGHFEGLVDIQVYHPPTRLIGGRPDWLAGAIGRLPATIPDEIRAESGRLLIQAFIEIESEDAVPLDQFILRPGEPRPNLFLKQGRYRVLVQDEQGNEILRRPLSVE